MSKQDKLERGEMSVEEMEKFSEELKVRTEVMKQLRDLRRIDEVDRATACGADTPSMPTRWMHCSRR